MLTTPSCMEIRKAELCENVSPADAVIADGRGSEPVWFDDDASLTSDPSVRASERLKWPWDRTRGRGWRTRPSSMATSERHSHDGKRPCTVEQLKSIGNACPGHEAARYWTGASARAGSGSAEVPVVAPCWPCST